GPSAPPLAEVVHGTTLITNTLIERKGVKTGLVTTSGMRDMVDIGREWRYDIYDLEIVMPTPLVDGANRVEVDERISARGDVVAPLTEAEIERVTRELAELGVESVAVSLLHSYVNEAHEKQLEARLQQALPQVAVS